MLRLLFTSSILFFCEPANGDASVLDTRYSKGWQAYVYSSTQITTTGVSKKDKDDILVRVHNSLVDENSLFETSIISGHLYPYQKNSFSLGVRFASTVARQAVWERELEKRIDLGIRYGYVRSIFFTGLYIKVYEEFPSLPIQKKSEDELEVENPSDEKSLRIEGEAGLQAPLANRLYGVASVGAGFYRLTRTQHIPTSDTDKSERSVTIKSNFITFSFAIGISFLIGEHKIVKQNADTNRTTNDIQKIEPQETNTEIEQLPKNNPLPALPPTK